MTDDARRPSLNPPLMIAITALLLSALGCLSLGSANQTSATPDVPQPELDVPTAREGYPPAIGVARAEDPAAELMSAVGAWTPSVFLDNLEAGRTSWTYHFYLPSTQSILWVTVVREAIASVVKTEAWETPPTLIDHQSWQIDSAEAMTVAMETCQAVLAEYPTSTVEARLSLAASQRAIVWHVSVTPHDPAGQPCVARVDGTSGVAR